MRELSCPSSAGRLETTAAPYPAPAQNIHSSFAFLVVMMVPFRRIVIEDAAHSGFERMNPDIVFAAVGPQSVFKLAGMNGVAFSRFVDQNLHLGDEAILFV